MFKAISLSTFFVLIGLPASATCPASPPFAPSLATGDSAVTAAWLQQNLEGMRLIFDDGTEVYGADGSYSYLVGDQRFDAPSYRFYDNGVRCIGYSQPRFDYYVVNNGSLVLVNSQGQRYVGRLTN